MFRPTKALSLAVSLIAASSHAQTATKSKRNPKVVVLDFPAQKTFDANTNATLNEFYATDLRQEGFSVITSADVAAALGVERQKQLTGCTESSCVAEIGNALGSDYIARGTIAQLEQSTAITLSIQDARGNEINRVAATVPNKTAEALLAKLGELVPRLVQPLHESGKLASVSPLAVAPATATSSTTPASGPSHIPSYVLFGIGGLGAIAGVYGGVAYSSDSTKLQNAVKGTPPAPSIAAGKTDRSNVSTDELVGWGGVGVGVVAAGVGLALYLLAPGAPVSTTTTAAGTPALAFRF